MYEVDQSEFIAYFLGGWCIGLIQYTSTDWEEKGKAMGGLRVAGIFDAIE